MERSEYVREKPVQIIYIYTIRNTIQNQCIQFYGLSEREKQFDDI